MEIRTFSFKNNDEYDFFVNLVEDAFHDGKPFKFVILNEKLQEWRICQAFDYDVSKHRDFSIENIHIQFAEYWLKLVDVVAFRYFLLPEIPKI